MEQQHNRQGGNDCCCAVSSTIDSSMSVRDCCNFDTNERRGSTVDDDRGSMISNFEDDEDEGEGDEEEVDEGEGEVDSEGRGVVVFPRLSDINGCDFRHVIIKLPSRMREGGKLDE